MKRTPSCCIRRTSASVARRSCELFGLAVAPQGRVVTAGLRHHAAVVRARRGDAPSPSRRRTSCWCSPYLPSPSMKR
eukprot:3896783-Prymnesium_polylepis.1